MSVLRRFMVAATALVAANLTTPAHAQWYASIDCNNPYYYQFCEYYYSQYYAYPYTKVERVHHRVYATRAEARRDLFHYIEGFYNPRRLHSALGYTSPAAAEKMAA